MTKLILATAIAIASLGASGFAFAASGHIIVSGPWGCRDCGFSNGSQLTGIAIEDAAVIGTVLPEPVESAQPTIFGSGASIRPAPASPAPAPRETRSDLGFQIQVQTSEMNN